MALRSDKLWKGLFHSNESKLIVNIEKVEDCQEDINVTELDHNILNDFIDTDGLYKDTEHIRNIYKQLLNNNLNTDKGIENNDIKQNLDVIKKEEINGDDNNRIFRTQFTCYSCNHEFDTENNYNEHIEFCLKNEDDQINATESLTDDGMVSCEIQVKNNLMNKKKKRYRKDEIIHRKKANAPSCDNGILSCDIQGVHKFVSKEKRRYKWKSEKEKHIYKKKPNAPNRDCGLCEEKFEDAKTLHQHLTEHGANNDLCCKLCDYQGRDFADMVSHRISHLPKEYKIEINCHLCLKNFRAPLRLQFHYRSVHLNEKGGKCTLCNKQFTNFIKWVNHERFHVTEGFICDICGKRYLFRCEIIDHIKEQHEGNKFICDICGMGFKRNFNLKQHLITRHYVTKVQCTHCDKIFKNEVILKAHLLEVKSDKPYKCEVCSKCYRTPSLLKAHMVWHTDVRKFSCGVCGVAYKSKQCLTIHTLKHTGHFPHKCDHCTRCFATSSQLKVHTSIHTGVRRHKCPHCPRSFNGKKVMLAHIDKCHDVK